MLRSMAVLGIACLLVLGLSGCPDPGDPASSCSVTDNGDGTATIACTDGTQVIIRDGTPGADADPCTVTDNGDGTMTIACPGSEPVTVPYPTEAPNTGTIEGFVVVAGTETPVEGAVVSNGTAKATATSDANGFFQITEVPIGIYTLTVSATGYTTAEVADVLVTAGQTFVVDVALEVPAATTGEVTGSVKRHDRPEDTILAGATVALVDAMALAATDSRTPLETLAAASPYTAVTAADGTFEITGVTPGLYFIHAVPAAADAETVLPGGDTSRRSFGVAAGFSVVRDVVLTQQPSSEATYLGSATCLGCHNGAVASDKTGFKSTLHALVYRAPDQVSSIQDLSDLPLANAAHAFFKDGNERDNTGADDEYGLRINSAEFPAFSTTAPADNYDLWLGYEDGSSRYFVQFSDTTGAILSEKYYVEFTFGGHGIYKERWITRILVNGSYDAAAAGGDSSYYILPVQFDEQLQPGVEPFHPYNFTNWGPPTANGGPTRTPSRTKSFDLNCAGCHFTGNSLERDTAGLYHADALNTTSAAGIIDYDGDTVKDEMIVGCESCHGPGSEHVASVGSPRLVISRYLSAERDAMVCGRCHTRGVGKGEFTGADGEHIEYPSKGTDDIEFPYPGMGYEEFAADYHADNPGIYGDTVGHSRQHHQQFPDMQKSIHYKNPYQLMACSDCHNMHNRDIGPSLVMENENNELCLSCHAPYTFSLTEGFTAQDEAESVSEHMSEYANMMVGYDPENISNTAGPFATGGIGQCATCHMPKTAASQSRFFHERVSPTGQPAGGRVRGDISSHVFDIVTPAASQSLLLNATANNQLPNSCGSCHFEDNGALDYAYKHQN